MCVGGGGGEGYRLWVAFSILNQPSEAEMAEPPKERIAICSNCLGKPLSTFILSHSEMASLRSIRNIRYYSCITCSWIRSSPFVYRRLSSLHAFSSDLSVLSSIGTLKNDIKSYLTHHDLQLAAVSSIGPSFRFINDNYSSYNRPREKYFRYTETFEEPRKWIFQWYEPSVGKGNVVGSRDVFQNGFKTLQKFVDGEKIEPKEDRALKALQRFFIEKGINRQNGNISRNACVACDTGTCSDSFCPAFCVFYSLHSLNTH